MTLLKTIKKISLTIILTLLFFSKANASIVNGTTNEPGSIYKYNALENKVSFNNLPNNTNILKEKIPQNSELLDNFTKELQSLIEKQNISIENIENTIKNLKDENKIKTFLLGNNLGVLRFQLVQIKDHAFLFNALILKTEDNTIKIQINNQINLSTEEQTKIENFILEQNNKFSLFGWLINVL